MEWRATRVVYSPPTHTRGGNTPLATVVVHFIGNLSSYFACNFGCSLHIFFFHIKTIEPFFDVGEGQYLMYFCFRCVSRLDMDNRYIS